MELRRGGGVVEVTLRIRGIARFFVIAFLLVWLGGWAAGEVTVGGLILHGAAALLRGELPQGMGSLLAAVGTGAFMLCWFTFWTIGGIAAGTEVLRMIAGADRVRADLQGLTVERRYGPFWRRRRYAREELLAIYATPSGALLATKDGSFDLTRLATEQERSELLSALNEVLRLPPLEELAILPRGWVEAQQSPSVLIQDPKSRSRATRVSVALSIIAVLGAALLLEREDASLGVLVALASLSGAGLALLAAYLGTSRSEWKLEHGRVTVARRLFGQDRIKGVATHLQLRESKDSDGDHWYALELVERAAPGARRWVVTRSLKDPFEPRLLGRWMARRTGLALVEVSGD